MVEALADLEHSLVEIHVPPTQPKSLGAAEARVRDEQEQGPESVLSQGRDNPPELLDAEC